MHKVCIIVRLSKFDTLKKALNNLGVTGMTVTQVMGCGIQKALYTGHIGDGKIFVYNVMRVVKVRTGEENYAALQDVE